jgi:hypothetical protein
MFALIQDEQEAKAARIDEATRDWLESQVFPTIPLVWARGNLRHLNEFVSLAKEPIEIGSTLSAPFRTPVAA